MAEIKGVGNLGSELQLKYIGENKDKPVAECRVYLSSARRDKEGEWVDRGEWFDVSVWGPCAEPAAKLLTKGDRIYLEGALGTDRWEDPESGEPRSKLKIDANLMLPWLPYLDSLAYKPRKGVVSDENE